MKKKSKKLMKLNLNKNIISTFNSNSVIGGASWNTKCQACPSYGLERACDPGPPVRTIIPTTAVAESTPEAGCYPISSPDEAC